MVRNTGDSPIDAKSSLRVVSPRRGSDDSSIDAKPFPAPLLIGLVLVIVGLIIAAYGIFSIVKAATGDDFHPFDLIGGLLITPLGGLLMLIGGMIMFAGSISFLRGRRDRRILY